MTQLGEGRGEGGAAFRMPARTGDVDFAVGGLDVHEVNGVGGDDCDVYLEPLAVIAAQLEVVDDAVIGGEVIPQVTDGLIFRLIRGLADFDDLGHRSRLLDRFLNETAR